MLPSPSNQFSGITWLASCLLISCSSCVIVCCSSVIRCPALIRLRIAADCSVAASIAAVRVEPLRTPPSSSNTRSAFSSSDLAFDNSLRAETTARDARLQLRARLRSGPNESERPSGNTTAMLSSVDWGSSTEMTFVSPHSPICSPKRRAASFACASVRVTSATSRSIWERSSRRPLISTRFFQMAVLVPRVASSRASLLLSFKRF